MRETNARGKRSFGRFSGAFLGRGLLLTIVGCGAPLVVTVGAALILGMWIGRISVTFPQNSSANRLSGTSGEARVKIEEDANQSPQIASYAGVLPGFVELGTTSANVDLNAGTVTGTVTEPSGATHDLADLLPGLEASREDKTGQSSQSSQGTVGKVILTFTSGSTTYIYELTVTFTTDASGATLTGDVTVRRRTIQNGIVLLDETGNGLLTAEPATETQFIQPLTSAAPPIRVDAGTDISVDAGASAQLQASATGGSGTLTYAWSPTAGLDAASALQPTATPSATTVYRLTVTDAKGQQAQDDVTVTVAGTSSVPSPLSVNAGPDVSIVSGGSAKLEAQVSGGVGVLTYSWEPTVGLDSASILQPTAAPGATTTYRLTVTDSEGQQAYDDVNVVVLAPPNTDVGQIQVYYNGSLLDSLDIASIPADTVVQAGRMTVLGNDYYGLFVLAGVSPQYHFDIGFDSAADATGAMAAAAIPGFISMGYFLNDSSNPANIGGDYDNSDKFVPLGPTPQFDAPAGTLNLRSVDGRIVGTFDVTVTQKLNDTAPTNTMRWVGNLNLPNGYSNIGGAVVILP